MKKGAFFIVILMLMLAITCWGYLGSIGRIPFIGGSVNDAMEIVSGNFIFPIIFLIIIFILIIVYLVYDQWKILVLIFFLITVWGISGRTIGIIIIPEGRMSTGWFYLETKRFNLCSNDDDCETIVYSHTKIEKLMFWRLKIKNKNGEHIVFIGPFTWEKTTKMFSSVSYIYVK